MTAPLAPSDHEGLEVWQLAMELLVETYSIAKLLPAEERHGLASQIRRAAVSIPANIAEGSGRSGPRDRLRFLTMGRGSWSEHRTLLIAVERLGYLEPSRLARAYDLSGQVGRLLNGLRRYVARKAGTGD